MTREEIGSVLKGLRISSGKTQKEVAELIGRNQQIVGHWETGYSQPDANTLFELCDLYGTSVDEAFGFLKSDKSVSAKEFDMIKNFRSLDQQGQETVRYILDNEKKRCEKISELNSRINELETEISEELVPKRIWAYYGKNAAAGKNVGFIDVIAGTIEMPVTDENKNADYTIGVSGDSMEPTYYDGDIVYVQKKTDLNIGDIGIFQRDNEIFIKEVGEYGLISHNKKYKPMISNSRVYCLGKVIGKIEE